MKPESSLLSPATPRAAAGDKILLVKGIAGLGNRILCAMGAVLYARLSGRRLVIDWTDPLYSSNGDNVFHRFFTSPSCSPGDEIPQTDSVVPVLWRGRLAKTAKEVVRQTEYDPDQVRHELSIDLGNLDYQEEVAVVVQYDARIDLLRKHFQDSLQELAKMPEEVILEELLREELLLRPEIQSRVEHFKRSRFRSQMVGVHVRFSDYRVRIVAIIKHLNALLRRERDLQIFLATDNFEIKKMFELNYPGVVTTPHWYGNPGRPLHNSSENSDRTENAIEALIDIYLLAECDHLIYDGSSSFSQLASLLSSAPSHHKVDVAAGQGKKHRRMRGIMTRILRRVRFSSWAFRLLPRLVPIRKL